MTTTCRKWSQTCSNPLPQKGSQSNDPFWDTAASMLLMALVFYLHYEAPEDEKNFAMIMEMLRAGEVREDDDSYQSPLDELFERLEMRSPDHIAVKYYKDYRSGSAKTLKSIQITLAARLEKFNLSSVAALTATDELDLASLGEKMVALFALIPDNDSSFNFFSQPALRQHLPGAVLQRRPGAWRKPCPCQCISSWTSLPTSACRTTSTSCWPPCGAGTFRCPSSSRTSPSSRRCTKNNGNPSWGNCERVFVPGRQRNQHTQADLRELPGQKHPSGWTLTARAPAIPAATPPTTRSLAGSF